MPAVTPEKNKLCSLIPVSSLVSLGLLAICSATPALADHSPPVGAAFSNPDEIMEMEPGWAEKKVVYDSNVGEADLVISLGQQTHPALHEYVEQYAREKGIKIVIQEGTCGATAKKLTKKSINLGTHCCPPGKTDRKPGLEFHTIGIAPIALVTNTANPIKNLTASEARDIFSGEDVYWSEIPEAEGFKFSNKPIKPVVRLHCKKRPGHWRLLLDNADLFSPRANSVGIIPDMIARVAETKTAIGYETLFMLDVHKSKGEVKVLTVDGHHPSDLEYAQQGKYPFYRTYNLTTWANDGEKRELALDLINKIVQHLESNTEKLSIVPVSKLRLAGWKFKGGEMTGTPNEPAVAKKHIH